MGLNLTACPGNEARSLAIIQLYTQAVPNYDARRPPTTRLVDKKQGKPGQAKTGCSPRSRFSRKGRALLAYFLLPASSIEIHTRGHQLQTYRLLFISEEEEEAAIANLTPERYADVCVYEFAIPEFQRYGMRGDAYELIDQGWAKFTPCKGSASFSIFLEKMSGNTKFGIL